MQIGLGLWLGTRQIGGFSPATLFAAGEQGGWYDPSDLSTMFQDSAGATPVTATGQTVGLLLDKSQGLALGPELVTNGTFDTNLSGWTVGTDPAQVIPTWDNGRVSLARGAGGNTGFSQGISTIAGRTYLVSFTVVSGVAAFGGGFPSTGGLTVGQVSRILTATGSGIGFWPNSLNSTTVIDNISVKELAGNHLTQATAASRPIYGIEPFGGRRNLLVRTEEFENAAWTKNAATVTANSSTAPDGTAIADTLTDTVTNDVHVAFQSVSVASATTYTFSAYVKAGTLNHAMLRIGGNAFGIPSPSVKATLTGSGSVTVLEGSVTNPTIVAVGDGWYRVSFTSTTVSSVFTAPQVGPHNNGATAIYTGSGTGTVLAWGAQLETGSLATAYQRVTDQWNVTQAGVPSVSYVQYDGTDDWFISPTITPGIDKAQVFAGVRKLSDAAFQAIAETSVDPNSSVGSFSLGAASLQGDASRRTWATVISGSVSGVLGGAFVYPAPDTKVVTLLDDISQASAALETIMRLNGIQQTLSISGVSAGTGNFLAYPLYIGRRGGISNPFNGRMYQMIVRFGANLDAATIAATETFVNSKTGAY